LVAAGDTVALYRLAVIYAITQGRKYGWLPTHARDGAGGGRVDVVSVWSLYHRFVFVRLLHSFGAAVAWQFPQYGCMFRGDGGAAAGMIGSRAASAWLVQPQRTRREASAALGAQRGEAQKAVRMAFSHAPNTKQKRRWHRRRYAALVLVKPVRGMFRVRTGMPPASEEPIDAMVVRSHCVQSGNDMLAA
jgi:hypothetical protein